MIFNFFTLDYDNFITKPSLLWVSFCIVVGSFLFRPVGHARVEVQMCEGVEILRSVGRKIS